LNEYKYRSINLLNPFKTFSNTSSTGKEVKKIYYEKLIISDTHAKSLEIEVGQTLTNLQDISKNIQSKTILIKAIYA
jgi:hypothetical protein